MRSKLGCGRRSETEGDSCLRIGRTHVEDATAVTVRPVLADAHVSRTHPTISERRFSALRSRARGRRGPPYRPEAAARRCTSPTCVGQAMLVPRHSLPPVSADWKLLGVREYGGRRFSTPTRLSWFVSPEPADGPGASCAEIPASTNVDWTCQSPTGARVQSKRT